MVDSLIPQFVQSYYAAQAAVETGDRTKALAAYQQLLGDFKQISASNLERPHKELAHQQVQSIYASVVALPANVSKASVSESSVPVSSAPISQVTSGSSVDALMSQPSFMGSLGAKDFVTIGVFAMLIMLVLFFKPEYIGLSTVDVGNHAPDWIGTTTLFDMQVGIPKSIQLDALFRDVDGDELVFLATSSPGIDVSVSGSVVTLLASFSAKGTSTVVVMASDLTSITKVPLTISVI